MAATLRNIHTCARSRTIHDINLVKLKEIPTVKGLPLVGTIFSIMAAGGASKMHLYVDRRHKEFGPIYREKIGPVEGVFISDGHMMRKVFASEGKYPKHIVPESWLLYNDLHNCKRGLLFMEDEEWYRFRKTMNSCILRPDNQNLITAIDLVAENFIEKWQQEKQIINLEKQLYKWSLEVILSVLMGAEVYSQRRSELVNSVEKLANVLTLVFTESATLSLIPAKLAHKMHLPVWRRFTTAAGSAMKRSNNLTTEMLAISEKSKKGNGLLKKMAETGTAKEDLIRIVTDLILAAGDTTAYTMQWLLHLLSKHPEMQHSLYEEVKNLNLNDAVQSPLLKGALRESLRLFPVAPFITRYMPKDVQIDGYQINAGELILMSLYSSGRNSDNFPEPHKFSPERWLRTPSGYEKVFNPYASLPFAIGSRSCIGKKIAETQILVTMFKVIKHFKIRPETNEEIDITLRLISVPSKPVRLSLKMR